MKTLTAFVVGCILFIVIYVIIAIYLQTKGIELGTALTAGVFGFFGTEIAACGFIKMFKIKKDF